MKSDCRVAVHPSHRTRVRTGSKSGGTKESSLAGREARGFRRRGFGGGWVIREFRT
jgi:hypothetical protein